MSNLSAVDTFTTTTRPTEEVTVDNDGDQVIEVSKKILPDIEMNRENDLKDSQKKESHLSNPDLMDKAEDKEYTPLQQRGRKRKAHSDWGLVVVVTSLITIGLVLGACTTASIVGCCTCSHDRRTSEQYELEKAGLAANIAEIMDKRIEVKMAAAKRKEGPIRMERKEEERVKVEEEEDIASI